jgi:sporulation protein YlmC with PRC-barrel domain
MSNRSGRRKAIPWSALLWAFVVLSATAQTNHLFSPLRTEQLLGLNVEDSDGRKIGTLRNLIVDMQTGTLRYAVVSSGGIAGVGTTSRLAPAQFVSAATTKRDTLAINVTTARWNATPSFKSSQLASLAEPGRAEAITRYFEQADASTNFPKAPLSATGADRAGQASASEAKLKLTSDVIGHRVVSNTNEKIGEILDLLVSFGPPHETFAVIAPGRIFRRGHEYAVPLSALNAGDGGKLVLNVDSSTLQNAPAFDQAAWSSRTDPNRTLVYTYPSPTE